MKIFVPVFFLIGLLHPAQTLAGEAGPGCRIDGCSSQLCNSDSSEQMGSTCEWLESYGCYQKLGRCEKQESGDCGWTLTPELETCLANAEKPQLQK